MKKWFFLFLLFLSSYSHSYQMTSDFIKGFYWKNFPLNFTLVERNEERRNYLSQVIDFAVEEWERETGLFIWNVSENTETNIIRWTNNFAEETKMDPEVVLAIAIRRTEGPYIARSEIVINGSHNAFNTSNEQVNQMNLKTTLIHELGHTVGLDHSEVNNAIMAPSLQFPYLGLHQDDITGMDELVKETKYRQDIQYTTPLLAQESQTSKQLVGCGTIVNVTGASSLGGTTLLGAMSAILSFLSGFSLSLFKKIMKK